MFKKPAAAALGFILCGPPGGGKGTIAKLLQTEFPLMVLGTGDIIRSEIRSGSALGQRVKDTVNAGGLVPDEMVNDLVAARMKNMRSTDHWVLDGFPRTREQAQFLQTLTKPTAVINVDVPFDTIVQRLQERLVHPASGRIYNLSFNPPKEAGKDDVTGEPLVQRDDDKPEVVQDRLEAYRMLTEPVIDFYNQLGLVQTFSGTETNVIYPRIHSYLSSFPQLRRKRRAGGA